MENKKRYSIKNILLATLWVVLGGATVFLLVAAIQSKPARHCKGIEINIHGVSNNFFVDKKDILDAITAMEKTNPVGKTTGSFDLMQLEGELKKNVWIKSAQLFFDNNEILQVIVHEREPVARVFTTAGTTFYIDDELAILPLSEKFSARLPVFTGFPLVTKIPAIADSILLMDIKNISLAIQKDSFSMAMIEQVDITAQRLFEMIPKIGNQLIVFGDASATEAKLGKLKMFYKEIMVKAGWNRYSVINLQYKNQVVAKIKGAEDIAADSLRTMQLMKMIAARAQQDAEEALQNMQQENDRHAVDSTMIQQSIQRDETYESPAVNENTDEQLNPPVLINVKPAEEKQAIKPIVKPVQKPVPQKIKAKDPKALLPKKNEY